MYGGDTLGRQCNGPLTRGMRLQDERAFRMLPGPFKLQRLDLAGEAVDDSDVVPRAVLLSAVGAAVSQQAVVLLESA